MTTNEFRTQLIRLIGCKITLTDIAQTKWTGTLVGVTATRVRLKLDGRYRMIALKSLRAVAQEVPF